MIHRTNALDTLLTNYRPFRPKTSLILVYTFTFMKRTGLNTLMMLLVYIPFENIVMSLTDDMMIKLHVITPFIHQLISEFVTVLRVVLKRML